MSAGIIPIHIIEYICKFLPFDEYRNIFPINMNIFICKRCLKRISNRINYILEQEYGIFYLDDFSDWNQEIDTYVSFPLYIDYIIYRKNKFIENTSKHILQRSISEYFYFSQIPYYHLDNSVYKEECFYELLFEKSPIKKAIFQIAKKKYIDAIDNWTYDEFCYKCKSFDCNNPKHYI